MYADIFKSFLGKETLSFEELLKLMNMSKAEFKRNVEEDTGLPYKNGLLSYLEGYNITGLKTNATIGNYQIEDIYNEFIVTRNGTYTVLAEKEGYIGEIQIEITGIEEEKFSEIYATTTTYTDGNGRIAKIPAGFAVGTTSGINTIENGLVITDAVDNEGYSIGNEFVWIPVENEDEFVDVPYEFGYSDGQGTEEKQDYESMRTKVLEHDGFYIGRYEAGYDTLSKSSIDSAEKVVTKRGVIARVEPWGISLSNVGNSENPGAAYLAQNMYEESTSVTSTLIYGCQWNEMCKFIEDPDRKSPEVEKKQLTGRMGEDNSKNIYDLAGNEFEWSMSGGENIVDPWRYAYGGAVGNNSHNKVNTYHSRTIDNECGFRCTLYIN